MINYNNIIKEEINNFLLNEALTDIVYHFTSLDTLLKIIDADAFYLPSSYGSFSDDLDKKKKFYMSLTRQKNSKLGYSRSNPVRITLDGNLLNYRFKGKPINYWGASMGKNSYFANPSAYGTGDKIDYYQSNTENEDRLFSNEPVIYNFHKYVKRIDVLIDRENENDMEYGKNFVYSKFRKLIHVYDNEDDFNKQPEDDINGIFEFDGRRNNSRIISNRAEYDILEVIYFMSVIENINYNELKKYSAMKLKEYGLDKYITYIVNNITSKNHYTIDDLSIRNNMKRLHKENSDMETYAKVAKMTRDFFQKYSFNNENDAKRYLKKYYEDKFDKKKIDYNKKIKFLVLFVNNMEYIIPFPDKTPFFKVFPYSKDILLDEVPYYIDSHKSKDDESFKKYLMHLVKSNVSISKMISIIDKMDINDDMKKSLLNYGFFQYVDLSYDNVLWGHFRYLNSEDEKYVENLFIKE